MTIVAESPHNKYGSAISIRNYRNVNSRSVCKQGTVELNTIESYGIAVHSVYNPRKMVQTRTYKLRLINGSRNKLTVTVTERVLNAMVTENLDYCNSLLNGITANEIDRIQKVQNTAARLITNRDRRRSATVMLNDLHWLSIKKRVMYKILLFVYKTLHDTTPDYTTTCLNDDHPTRTLRSCEGKCEWYKRQICTPEI